MQLDFGTENMIVEVEDGVGWVTFNNPKRRNAVNWAMWQAIPEIFADMSRRDDVRCVVMNWRKPDWASVPFGQSFRQCHQ